MKDGHLLNGGRLCEETVHYHAQIFSICKTANRFKNGHTEAA